MKNKLEIGKEYPKKNEDAFIDRMLSLMKKQMRALYANQPKSLRQVHNKMHGCLKAEFIVAKDLPPNLKVGIFKEEKSFQTWLRFSNGQTRINKDQSPDTRGLAMKLMGVSGEKLLEYNEKDNTHDIILASGPTFFSKDIYDFQGLLRATIRGKVSIILYLITHWPLAYRVFFKVFNRCKHPLAIDYFSTSPYRFGNDSTAVKYHTKLSSGKLEYTDHKDPDFLKKNLITTLKQTEIYIDFYVQFQTDAEKMPIENAIIAWDSPFHKVATIRIPAQEFDTPMQRETGENLTFNIWRCLAEHRPLGGFNRCRKRVYEAMYTFRHDANKIDIPEPLPSADFFTNTNGINARI